MREENGESRAVAAGTLHANPKPAAHNAPSDNWLKGLKAKHKQFFDNPLPNAGVALVHVINYYDTYNRAFNVKDTDIDAVLAFYAATTFYGLDDAAWSKYDLGEFLDVKDAATGKPATANPWLTAPVVLGMTLPAASLESLHRRGAALILCNNAPDDLLRSPRGKARARRQGRLRGPAREHSTGGSVGAGNGRGGGAGAAVGVDP